jgi:hypothetical protein
MDTQTAPLPIPAAAAATVDAGTIRLGAAMRRPALAPAADAALSTASVADAGRIRLGAAMRVPGRRNG